MKNLSSVFLILLVFSFKLNAHQLSTAYLELTKSENEQLTLNGQWKVAVMDLEHVVEFDKNADDVITWQEIKNQKGTIHQYLVEKISAQQNNEICAINSEGDLKIDSHFNESYIVTPIQISCPNSQSFSINYSALFEVDANHKAISSIGNISRVFTLNEQTQTFSFEETSYSETFVEYVHQGILHIWMGTDHILFLIALLLGCVLVRKQGEWQRVESKKQILIDTAWIITAFTLAHSITLTATAINIISPNTRWVELGIALSVLFAAINNIWPMIVRLGWITFCFGLLHGMGFASVLGKLGLSNEYQLMSILAFNLGVEIGQLVILAICLPLLMLLRNNTWYKKAIMPAGSVVIAIMAIQWSIERF